MKLYTAIASAIGARARCSDDWLARWDDRLDDIARNILPRGSGFDSGMKIDLEKSTAEKIVIHADFHHMNEGGYYDGWTEHTVTIRPSLQFGIDITVSGRNRNEIKDYIAETFHHVMTREFQWKAES